MIEAPHVCNDRCRPPNGKPAPYYEPIPIRMRRARLPSADPEWDRAFVAAIPEGTDYVMPGGPCVYIALDATGHAIYIGSADNATKRIGTHAARSAWYSEAERFRVIQCADRRAAFDLERRLIGFYVPRYNLA